MARMYALDGIVRVQSPEQTIVLVRVGVRRALWWQLLAGSICFAVATSLLGDTIFIAFVVVVPILVSVMLVFQNAGLNPQSQTIFTHYLIERLDAAFAELAKEGAAHRAM
jgi:asparagine N-glycosylation enzyme membrane subunit Stt3